MAINEEDEEFEKQLRRNAFKRLDTKKQLNYLARHKPEVQVEALPFVKPKVQHQFMQQAEANPDQYRSFLEQKNKTSASSGGTGLAASALKTKLIPEKEILNTMAIPREHREDREDFEAKRAAEVLASAGPADKSGEVAAFTSPTTTTTTTTIISGISSTSTDMERGSNDSRCCSGTA